MKSKPITRLLLVAGMAALLLASSVAGLAVGPSAPTTAQATAALPRRRHVFGSCICRWCGALSLSKG